MGIIITSKHVVTSAIRFSPGKTVATPGALGALEESGESPLSFLKRHLAGDWGDACDDDKRENEESLKHGWRIMSVYHTARGQKLWIITELDRSVTTVLLPEEY